MKAGKEDQGGDEFILKACKKYAFCCKHSRQNIENLKSEIPLLDEVSSLTRDMDALERSLLLIVTEYQNKKVQYEASRSTDLSGTLAVI